MRLRRKRGRLLREPPAWDGLMPAFIDGKAMLVAPEVLEPYYREVMARHDRGDLAERFAASQFGSNWRQRQSPQLSTDPTFTDWQEIAREGRTMRMAQREKLPSKDFGLPGKGTGKGGKGPGSYPIDTKGRARSALSRASANASPAEQTEIKRKVKAKFPSIKQKGKN